MSPRARLKRAAPVFKQAPGRPGGRLRAADPPAGQPAGAGKRGYHLGKFSGVLLVSDFDDTLSCEEGGIPPANREALDYFTRGGGIFTVATGRARPNFAPHAGQVPINAPVILSNGSALYDFRTGEMVYETFLPERVRGDMEEVARAIPSIGFEAYHNDQVYTYQPNAVTRRHLERAGLPSRETPIADMPLPWSKAILQQRNEVLLEAQRYMLERWGEHYEVIFSNLVLLELTRKGSSKGGMVELLARRLGIGAQHVYCIGDNQNDIPMLAVSAIPFAPADCAPEVRAWGARLLCPCGSGCVAQAVGILDNIY